MDVLIPVKLPMGVTSREFQDYMDSDKSDEIKDKNGLINVYAPSKSQSVAENIYTEDKIFLKIYKVYIKNDIEKGFIVAQCKFIPNNELNYEDFSLNVRLGYMYFIKVSALKEDKEIRYPKFELIKVKRSGF